LKYRLVASVFVVVILAALFFSASRSKSRAEGPDVNSGPKLIVVLVIDQFRYDYLARFRPYFVKRGFNLLLRGANFVDCRYNCATTVTGPAHASLFTGAYPDVHGIVGNDWYDPSLHRRVNCVEDPATRAVGSDGPGASPIKLIGTTIGDELRLESNFQSKVIAISLKDRAAVIPGGHTANAAYWYDPKNGHFVSSTYYMQALPSWVAAFNDSSTAKPYCGKAWEALPETPGTGGKVLSAYHSAPNEPCPDENFVRWLEGTPYMNEMELKLAAKAVKAERLGQRPTTDLLAVSLSVNDSVGHAKGPYSSEVADVTIRTDRYLADFIEELDRSVGLDNVWIAFSSDHGVAPSPLFINVHRLGPGSAPSAQLIKDVVERALTQNFGADQWVDDVEEPYLSFNQRVLSQHRVDRPKAEAVAAQATSSIPGVAAAFGRTQLFAGSVPDNLLVRKVLHSLNNRRGGDVFFVLEPFSVPVSKESETTHGTPWSYDAQVPLVLWGSRFRSGTFAISCQPIDLAPTLAAALGINQPSGVEGHPLNEALK
jgi:predicted AlkP superfamily pyrophosphatase or phosphodiesterase